MYTLILGYYILPAIDMQAESPLHTDLLKHHHRWVLMSSDDEGNYTRQDEAILCDSVASGSSHSSSNPGPTKRRSGDLERHEVASTSHQTWPVHDGGEDHSPSQNVATGEPHSRNKKRSSSTSQTHKPMEVDREPDEVEQLLVRRQGEVIIHMRYHDTDAWDLDADSTSSTTSTPDCKRGRHTDSLTQMALCKIKEESHRFNKLARSKRRYAGKVPSVHILADSRLGNWLTPDGVCRMDYHPGWGFKTWVAALRTETI